MRRARASLLLLPLLASGCDLFSDEPYLIEELTVVAIVAEPPEVHPDERSLITAFIVDPKRADASVAADWSFCNVRKYSQNAPRCGGSAVPLPSEEVVPLSSGVFASSAEHGVTTGELTQVPTLLLQAGFWEHVRIAVRAGDDDTEALKRLVVVSPEATANVNPVIDEVRVSQQGTALPLPLRARPGDELELQPLYDPEQFESYRVLGADGRFQPRQEEALFTWHVTGGKLDRWVTEAGDEAVLLELPDRDRVPGGLVQVFVVLRDSRGGADVWFGSIELTP